MYLLVVVAMREEDSHRLRSPCCEDDPHDLLKLSLLIHSRSCRRYWPFPIRRSDFVVITALGFFCKSHQLENRDSWPHYRGSVILFEQRFRRSAQYPLLAFGILLLSLHV